MTDDEREWYAAHGVTITEYGGEDYPTRLLRCPDAPQTLYTHATADLNAPHTVSVVGTRHITPYGKDVIEKLIGEIAELCPDCVIVSGLAYGVDIHAHRAALARKLRTVAVVAHGPDTVYPSAHRREAELMTAAGGDMITEYPIRTQPIGRNFLSRNRIIAGLGDATIVIESAHHGGSLTTARLANEYGRPVFAVPGPINSPNSEGCNNLIRDGKARLLTSAADMAKILHWEQAAQLADARRNGIERQLFPDLTPDETLIVNMLRNADTHANDIVRQTALNPGAANAALFSLEMKGLVRSLPGGVYHLIN